jgi:hypothetical protein|tara:strand:+ start:64365 stop:66266 length:1902 start_codon:yes stop_codon:yes gene_type:complete
MLGLVFDVYNQWLTYFLDRASICLSPSPPVADQAHVITELQARLNAIRTDRKPVTAVSLSLLEMCDILFSVSRVEAILNEYFEVPRSLSWKVMATEFLQQRAEKILNGPFCYTFHTDLPVNDLCVTLARLCDPQHQNSLLMPGVRKEDIYGNNFDELNLGQFILTDDKLSFINLCDIVDTAFTRSVGIEANIYLTTTAEGQSRNLSNTEIQRLGTVYHRLEKIRHQLNDRSFLARVMRSNLFDELVNLRNGLRDGDVDHDGEEMNAGAAANEAIVRFRQYYEGWSEDKKSRVCAIYTNGRTLGEIFDIIFRDPNQSRHNNGHSVIYCMAIVGSQLESIIYENRRELLGIKESQQERIHQLKYQLLEDIQTKKWMRLGTDEYASLYDHLALLMNDLLVTLSKQTKNPEYTELMLNMVNFVYFECERMLAAKRFGKKLDSYTHLLLAIGLESACSDKRSKEYNDMVLNESFKRISLLSSCATAFFPLSAPTSKNNWQQWILAHPALQSYPFLIDDDCEYTQITQYMTTYQATEQRTITTDALSELRTQEARHRSIVLRTADEQRMRSKSKFRAFYPASAHADSTQQTLYNFEFWFYVGCITALTACYVSLVEHYFNSLKEDLTGSPAISGLTPQP